MTPPHKNLLVQYIDFTSAASCEPLAAAYEQYNLSAFTSFIIGETPSKHVFSGLCNSCSCSVERNPQMSGSRGQVLSGLRYTIVVWLIGFEPPLTSMGGWCLSTDTGYRQETFPRLEPRLSSNVTIEWMPCISQLFLTLGHGAGFSSDVRWRYAR